MSEQEITESIVYRSEPAKPRSLRRRVRGTTTKNIKMKTGTELLADERARQISGEGWSAKHDDSHVDGEMIDAGLSYIYASINLGNTAMQKPPREWPWAANWWKPADNRVRNLVKAGALIAAEIDRLQRASNVKASNGGDNER